MIQNIDNLKAAVLFKTNKKLNFLSLKIPKLKTGQVLVKIYFSGVCRSQLMEIAGGRNNKKWLPHLLGHEACGLVNDTGPGVKKVKKGDKVILSWIRSNGKNAGNPKFSYLGKKINAGKVTTFSNFSIVSENRLVKKPINISFKDSIYLGCSFSTGMGMVLNETKVSKNTKVVLIGLGGIGLGVLLALKFKKVKNVIVLDNDRNKIKLAKMLGVKYFFSSLNINTKNKILKKFGTGADICYESAGKALTIKYGMGLISNKGRLHFASHPHEKEKLLIKPHDLILGKKITGSWGGSVKPDKDFKKFSKILKIINFKLNVINSKIYSLENINKAIDDFKKKKVFRPIIKMQH